MIRLSAVSFLNTRPITYGIERSLDASRFELSFDLPSRCAERLAAGDADLGLIPVGAYATSETELRIVPGIAIASHGAVRTVLMVSEVPWEELEEIALDGASRSSALLLRLLCHERGLTPRFREVPHEEVLGVAGGRIGALVIGDAAFEAARRFPHVQDLGEAWRALTGLPFVYAVWAGRPDAVDARAIATLQASLQEGLAARPTIARAWGEAHGGEPASYEAYLTRNIHYQLGSEELSGMSAFFERARAAGLISQAIRPILYTNAATARQQPVARAARSMDALLADAAAGGRLSPEDAARLYAEAPVLELGAAADQRRRALHPEDVVTYIIDRNVNYTNVCVTRCKFCNFYRPPTNKTEGYVLSREQLARKFQETVDLGGVQILLQGGLNPNLPISWYEELFRWMKANFPLAIHGLSPEEIRYIAEIENMSIRAVIERLIAAGLDSIPGGGAEILDDEIRHAISPLKCTTDTWMEVMRQAHALGLRTTATMVFGFGEEPRHIINHLERLRALQDQTAGFTAFICWPFQAEGTRLKLRDDTTAMRYLRLFALSRLYLDNFPSLQVSWPTMGPEVGQVGLRFGGNDFGSAMIEENVVSQAGAIFKLSADDIERYIRAAGFTPRRRNMRYERLAADNKPGTLGGFPNPPATTPLGEAELRQRD
ncbi:MAG TPA: cyclic dehypoxanthinyl futalosine synthase [Polyangia bacterium]|nr:cyclic dehypoxanthinyl futalosine synthase [Polyangia bacterium]